MEAGKSGFVHRHGRDVGCVFEDHGIWCVFCTAHIFTLVFFYERFPDSVGFQLVQYPEICGGVKVAWLWGRWGLYTC